jgi:hypothetical protein
VLIAKGGDLHRQGESRPQTLHFNLKKKKKVSPNEKKKFVSVFRGVPRATLDSLDSSTIQMNLSETTSTIFSLRSAPPPPFTRDRKRSTSSAPSIDTSRRPLTVHIQDWGKPNIGGKPLV